MSFWLMLFSLLGTGMSDMSIPDESSQGHWVAVGSTRDVKTQCGSPGSHLPTSSQFGCFCTATPNPSNLAGGIPYIPSEVTSQTRIGEAANPGPHFVDDDMALVTLGQSNPGGLRGKELHSAELGMGVWGYAETHLTPYTAHNFTKALRHLTRSEGRHTRILTGQHVACRTNSRWAGTWSGVVMHTDHPTHNIKLHWPIEHYNTGRIMAARHFIGGTAVLMGTVYGYPRNATWPQGHLLTNELIRTFTQDLVIGSSGIRVITGDFNYQAGALPDQQIWAQYGWKEAQAFGNEVLGLEWNGTTTSTSAVDQIWLSPEAQALCRYVGVRDVFAGHSTIFIQLAVPSHTNTVHYWPRPAKLPWTKLGKLSEPADTVPTFDSFDNATTAFETWGKHLEQHIEKHAKNHHVQLPANWQGRAQRTRPDVREEQNVICRPSREGELSLKHDLVGTAVRRWYTQARRLQSLVHSLRAGKQTNNARLYRIETWSAIRRAKGFVPSFIEWWEARTLHYPDSPQAFPQLIPALDDMQLLYEEFVSHFRAFEKWHQGQRQQSLKNKYDNTNHRLFADLKPPRANELDILWEDTHFEVIAHDNETGQAHISEPLEPDENAVWMIDGSFVQPCNFDGVVCTLPQDTQVTDSSVLTRRFFHHDTDSIHKQLCSHWASKWQASQPIDDEKWRRVTAFTKQYMPKLDIVLEPITEQQWRKALNRLKSQAATGPDGIARADLLAMSQDHTRWLVDMLNSIEQQTMEWPTQLLTGLITCLAKHSTAHTPSDYRPIHLFSIIYRLWGSIRTRELLRVLLPHLPEEAYGFIPGRETSQIWCSLQAWIETAIETDWHLTGLSTDVQKCFNCIEREQSQMLSAHLGIPDRVIKPWQKFLATFERRFQVRNTVSMPLTSNRGYAEGCPLSILAMIQINWAHHTYMGVYCPKVIVKSFVDNLDLLSFGAVDLMQGMACTISCLDMWGLAVDEGKTYVWSPNSEERTVLRAWSYRLVTDAAELGGSLTFGRATRNRELRARGDKLCDKWDRLKKIHGSNFQQAHGSVPCFLARCFSWHYGLHCR